MKARLMPSLLDIHLRVSQHLLLEVQGRLHLRCLSYTATYPTATHPDEEGKAVIPRPDTLVRSEDDGQSRVWDGATTT